MRIVVNPLAAALVAGGVACLSLVHRLTGLFFIEVAVVRLLCRREQLV